MKAKIIERKPHMTDLGAIARATKRVTFEDIYIALDVLKDQQSEDSRHINQRIDNLGSQLNQRIDTLNQKIDTQTGQVNQRIDSLNQKIDTQVGQLNQRMDTVIQMLLDLSKQISSQKNQ